MAAKAQCPHCGAAAITEIGKDGWRGYPGFAGYEYIRFTCGAQGTRARDNGQFAYTGKVTIASEHGASTCTRVVPAP